MTMLLQNLILGAGSVVLFPATKSDYQKQTDLLIAQTSRFVGHETQQRALSAIIFQRHLGMLFLLAIYGLCWGMLFLLLSSAAEPILVLLAIVPQLVHIYAVQKAAQIVANLTSKS